MKSLQETYPDLQTQWESIVEEALSVKVFTEDDTSAEAAFARLAHFSKSLRFIADLTERAANDKNFEMLRLALQQLETAHGVLSAHLLWIQADTLRRQAEEN